MAKGPQRLASATLQGFVMSPSRRSTWNRQTGEVVTEFETDVVQSDAHGTSSVMVKSDQPLLERVDAPVRVEFDVVLKQWPDGRTFGELVYVHSVNGSTPAAKSTAPTK